MDRHNGMSPIWMSQEVMAAPNAQLLKPGLAECGDELPASESR
jgi:hypothetical protein